MCVWLSFQTEEAFFTVPCKRRNSVNSGTWLRRFDDVTGVAKTDILRWAMGTKR